MIYQTWRTHFLLNSRGAQKFVGYFFFIVLFGCLIGWAGELRSHWDKYANKIRKYSSRQHITPWGGELKKRPWRHNMADLSPCFFPSFQRQFSRSTPSKLNRSLSITLKLFEKKTGVLWNDLKVHINPTQVLFYIGAVKCLTSLKPFLGDFWL